MKKLHVFVMCLVGIMTQAQVEDAWVIFRDKPLSSDYIANPLTMLSQKSLDRRIRQGISINNEDVPVHQPYISSIENQQGISVLSKSKWFNAVHVKGEVLAIAALGGLSFVEKIEYANRSRNSGVRPANRYVQKETSSKWEQVQVDFPYGTGNNQVEMLNGHLLHQEGYTGSGMTIAIMDTGYLGVDTASPFKRLRDNNQILGGYDFVNKTDDIYTTHNHGTRVLSCIAGYEENQLVGTGPDANFYLFITEDLLNESPLEESLWVEAAERADSLGVDIINTSLGYTTFDNSDYNYSYEDMDGKTTYISRGLEFAFSKGIFCVASAGNEGGNSWRYIATPGDAISALTVGAVDSDESYAYFSSVGPSADSRIKPDVTAQGLGAIVAFDNGVVSPSNGTSFSGPIITGMIASVWQSLPNLTNIQLLQKVKESSHLYQNPNENLGYGIPDFKKLNTDNLSVNTYNIGYDLYYSNPVGDVLNIVIKNKNSKIRLITIYTVEGQKVLNEIINSNESKFDLSGIKSGFYVMEVHFDDGVFVDKFVKM